MSGDPRRYTNSTPSVPAEPAAETTTAPAPDANGEEVLMHTEPNSEQQQPPEEEKKDDDAPKIRQVNHSTVKISSQGQQIDLLRVVSLICFQFAWIAWSQTKTKIFLAYVGIIRSGTKFNSADPRAIEVVIR